ncbi:MAG: peroxiredoxin family protein [Planctomycetes bacterium]|nr:peroxiredoxin family protein [Planctomycetota bacterium]
MRYAISAALLLLVITSVCAQRGRSNPFSEFHRKEALAIGQPAPQLHLQNTAGDEVNLRDYLGRWVFIEFGSYT